MNNKLKKILLTHSIVSFIYIALVFYVVNGEDVGIWGRGFIAFLLIVVNWFAIDTY